MTDTTLDFGEQHSILCDWSYEGHFQGWLLCRIHKKVFGPFPFTSAPWLV